MNILIVEDEKPNSDRLKRLVSEIGVEYSIMGILESVAETVSWLKGNPQPDIMLLDIRLSDGLSFEIFDHISITCPIIFTTAYDEYAVKAFKFNSVDYLLKPIDKDELAQALQKLQQWKQNLQPAVADLLSYLKQERPDYRSRFLLPFRDGYKSIMVSEIEYFCLEQKVVFAKLFSGASEILSQSMEELELQLDPKVFFRANRQIIVHIDSIEQILNSFNGKLKIVLKRSRQIEIFVSRDKAPQLKGWIDS